MQQDLCNAAKVEFDEKFIVLNAYIRREEKPKIKEDLLSFQSI